MDMQLRNKNKKVNYAEENGEERNSEVSEIVEDILNESMNVSSLFEHEAEVSVNTERQFKKILKKTNCDDWTIEAKRNQPRGSDVTVSFFFYISFHPAIFQLVVSQISSFLKENHNITFYKKKPDRYGKAVIKDTHYFKFPADGMIKDLVINFYPTTTSMDVRMTGNEKEAALKFQDKGNRNGACYFVQVIMPDLIETLYKTNNVEVAKKYWIGLAKKGYNLELKLRTPNRKKGEVIKEKQRKSKCDHCDKLVGKKLVIQCKECYNFNLEECLTNFTEGKLDDFRKGKDDFICDKCFPKIDANTLMITDNSSKSDSSPKEVTLEEDTDKQHEKHHTEENQSKYETLVEKYNLLETAFSEVNSKLQEVASHKDCIEEKEKLSNSLATLKEKHEQCSTQQTDEVNNSINTENEGLRESLKEKEGENEELKVLLKEKEKENMALENSLKTQENIDKEMKKTIKKQEDEIEKLKGSLNRENNSINLTRNGKPKI